MVRHPARLAAAAWYRRRQRGAERLGAAAFAQETLKRSRQRDLNRGFDEGSNIDPAWYAVDIGLQFFADFVGEHCRSRRDLRLSNVNKLSPFCLGSLPKHFCRGLNYRVR